MFEGQCGWGRSSNLKPRVGFSRVENQTVEYMCVPLCPVIGIPWGMVVDEE